MATKRVPRAPIRVSTYELAIIFRGESVSGHPGARGGPKISENRPGNFQNFQNMYLYLGFVFPIFVDKTGTSDWEAPPAPRQGGLRVKARLDARGTETVCLNFKHPLNSVHADT